MKPYIGRLYGRDLDQRLGYLDYVIPKIRENILRLEDDMLTAKQQLREYEEERKEINTCL